MKYKSKAIVIVIIAVLLMGGIVGISAYRKHVETEKMKAIVLVSKQIEIGNFDEAKDMIIKIEDEEATRHLRYEISVLEKIQGTWQCVGSYDDFTEKVSDKSLRFSFVIKGGSDLTWIQADDKFELTFVATADGISVKSEEKWDDYFFVGTKKEKSSEWKQIDYIVDEVTRFAFQKQ